MALERWNRRLAVLCLVFLLFVVILHTRHIASPIDIFSGTDHHFGVLEPTFKQEYELIQSLNINTSEIDYRRYCLTIQPKEGITRNKLVQLDWPIFNTNVADRVFVVPPVNEGDDQAVFPPCQQTHTIEVASTRLSLKANTNTLLLGTATFLSRLNESLPEMAHWLANTDTKLLVVLRDERPDEHHMRFVIEKADKLGIAVYLVSDGSMIGEAQSNFGLATHLYTHLSHSTRWVGIIDDDTFFPSLPRLLKALEPYDTALPWYIGGLSERHLGISTEGFKAWGGAGIFLSVPLLTLLAENHDECVSMSGTWGDALWRDCIFIITSPTVGLTPLKGLNQLDMFGDLSGWYESGLQTTPLSLHHWKSWHHFDVPAAHLITEIAGADTLFQRYKAVDNAVLTNGFSIVHYPEDMPDLGLVEGTMHPYPGAQMSDTERELKDSLGRLRPPLEKGREKVTWRFATALKMGNDCVRQFYVKGASAGQSDNDSVIEVDWCRNSR
jgi:hypothetical protein